MSNKDAAFTAMMESIQSKKHQPTPGSVDDIYLGMIKRAERIAKTPVEQEFPGLVSIAVMPYFAVPGMVFFHKPTGFLLHCGITMFPGIAPQGPDWVAAPVLLRYAATRRFDELEAVQAFKATYLQSVMLPATEEEAKNNSLEAAIAVWKDETVEIMPGILETYGMFAMKVPRTYTNMTLSSMRGIVAKYDGVPGYGDDE